MEAIIIIILMSLIFIILSLFVIYFNFKKDLIKLSEKTNKVKFLLFLELVFFCFTNDVSLAKAIKICNEKEYNIKKNINYLKSDEIKYKEIDEFSIKIDNDTNLNIKQ